MLQAISHGDSVAAGCRKEDKTSTARKARTREADMPGGGILQGGSWYVEKLGGEMDVSKMYWG
jgi:hypothetical protein